jgi:N-acetylglucosaminyldiphosphoundecaprenol N-acetyl-beta-D-mannosaminyltransferase
MSTNRINLFGIEIDVMTMPTAVSTVASWVTDGKPDCRFVVTPNVDHTVMFQERADLREVYEAADLILADGWPVVAASRLVGKPLPCRVAGSDLVPTLFSDSKLDKMSVFLLGAMPGVADRAADEIHKRWSNVSVVGTYSPPFGFEKNEEENDRILQMIAAAKPDVLVVGLGAPKQELWVHKHQAAIEAKAALCVGATIDFLAGEKSRAPRWIQSIGLEWFHRMMSEPKRLVKRYSRDAWVFPQLLWQEWQRSAKGA